MELSRQECWSEFPFPPPRDLPDPEMEPQSPVLGRFFTVWAIRKVAFKMTLGFLLGQLQISTWCLPSTYLSTRIKSCADAADFQHPQEEFRVESGNKALWENWQLFRELDILSRWFYKPNSCIFISRKALKSFTVNLLLVTSSALLQKICAWSHPLLLHQNHIYTDLPSCLFGAVSQSYQRCYLPL